MDLVSPLDSGEHLVILVAFAILLVGWFRAHAGQARRTTYLLLGAMAGAPVIFSALPGDLELLICGKEGVLDALTGGVLLALVVLASGRRAPWVLAGALMLLLEEVDYGQWWLGYASPPVLAELGLHPGNFNTHNLPVVDALWRLLPLTVVGLLAARDRWPALLARQLDRLRLPRLAPGLFLGGATLIIGALATVVFAGEARADESVELAVVAVVAVSWWSAYPDGFPVAPSKRLASHPTGYPPRSGRPD